MSFILGLGPYESLLLNQIMDGAKMDLMIL